MDAQSSQPVKATPPSIDYPVQQHQQPMRKKPESRGSIDSSGSLHHHHLHGSLRQHPPPQPLGQIAGAGPPLLVNTDPVLEGAIKNFMRSEKYARKIKVIVKATSVPGRQNYKFAPATALGQQETKQWRYNLIQDEIHANNNPFWASRWMRVFGTAPKLDDSLLKVPWIKCERNKALHEGDAGAGAGIPLHRKETYLDLREEQNRLWSINSYEQGIQYATSGQTDDAIRAYSQAILIDSKNVEAFVARGCTFVNLQKFRAAIMDFRQALTLDPTNELASRYLETTMQQEEQYQIMKAQESFHQGQSRNHAGHASGVNATVAIPSKSNIDDINELVLETDTMQIDSAENDRSNANDGNGGAGGGQKKKKKKNKRKKGDRQAGGGGGGGGNGGDRQSHDQRHGDQQDLLDRLDRNHEKNNGRTGRDRDQAGKEITTRERHDEVPSLGHRLDADPDHGQGQDHNLLDDVQDRGLGVDQESQPARGSRAEIEMARGGGKDDPDQGRDHGLGHQEIVDPNRGQDHGLVPPTLDIKLTEKERGVESSPKYGSNVKRFESKEIASTLEDVKPKKDDGATEASKDIKTSPAKKSSVKEDKPAADKTDVTMAEPTPPKMHSSPHKADNIAPDTKLDVKALTKSDIDTTIAKATESKIDSKDINKKSSGRTASPAGQRGQDRSNNSRDRSRSRDRRSINQSRSSNNNINSNRNNNNNNNRSSRRRSLSKDGRHWSRSQSRSPSRRRNQRAGGGRDNIKRGASRSRSRSTSRNMSPTKTKSGGRSSGSRQSRSRSPMGEHSKSKVIIGNASNKEARQKRIGSRSRSPDRQRREQDRSNSPVRRAGGKNAETKQRKNRSKSRSPSRSRSRARRNGRRQSKSPVPLHVSSEKKRSDENDIEMQEVGKKDATRQDLEKKDLRSKDVGQESSVGGATADIATTKKTERNSDDTVVVKPSAKETAKSKISITVSLKIKVPVSVKVSITITLSGGRNNRNNNNNQRRRGQGGRGGGGGGAGGGGGGRERSRSKSPESRKRSRSPAPRNTKSGGGAGGRGGGNGGGGGGGKRHQGGSNKVSGSNTIAVTKRARLQKQASQSRSRSR
ncbi:hypothetical protein BGZ83_011338 [Gryganskiella cystojenkinii]|nr:hypothetical protein BGZ83_011338 [Gryganskiella cystojenkinii]